MDAKAIRTAVGTVLTTFAVGVAILAGAPSLALAEPAVETPLYYLENRYTGEGMFTVSKAERDDMRDHGWTYVKVSQLMPTESESPVYRLYNPYEDNHIFTQDENEYRELSEYGWEQEGVKFYSDDGQGAPMYRLFASWITGQGNHAYTTSRSYYETQVDYGWSGDGIRWYGLRIPVTAAEMFQGLEWPDIDYSAVDEQIPPSVPEMPSEGVTGDEGRQDIVEFAKQFVGYPYVYAAEDPADGFDCSGLVQYVYGQFGLDLPRTTYDQIDALKDMGIWKYDIDELQPGAIIAMGGGSHVGIYAGRDPETGRYMMVDAANSMMGVVYREVYSIYWDGTFMGGANPL